jgi:hypothetical protein
MYSGQAWPQGRYKPLRADRNVQLDITRHIRRVANPAMAAASACQPNFPERLVD